MSNTYTFPEQLWIPKNDEALPPLDATVYRSGCTPYASADASTAPATVPGADSSVNFICNESETTVGGSTILVRRTAKVATGAEKEASLLRIRTNNIPRMPLLSKSKTDESLTTRWIVFGTGTETTFVTADTVVPEPLPMTKSPAASKICPYADVIVTVVVAPL